MELLIKYVLSYKQTPISWKNYELNKLGLPTLKEAFLLRSQSALEFSVKNTLSCSGKWDSNYSLAIVLASIDSWFQNFVYRYVNHLKQFTPPWLTCTFVSPHISPKPADKAEWQKPYLGFRITWKKLFVLVICHCFKFFSVNIFSINTKMHVSIPQILKFYTTFKTLCF